MLRDEKLHRERLLSASTICFFVPRGAEIIGAAKRYLNALPPVMDLIPGRITPRSYCHKANAGDSESPFHSPVPGGDHPGAGRTKPGRSPLRGAEQTWGRGEGCSWFWSPSSPKVWGRDAGRSPCRCGKGCGAGWNSLGFVFFRVAASSLPALPHCCAGGSAAEAFASSGM